MDFTNINIKEFLDEKVNQYNQKQFIDFDPISVPHKFTLKQDIEITGLISAIFAWGQRKTAINKANEFIILMDSNPYFFIKNHKAKDLDRFSKFKHRTFNAEDAVYFITALKHLYTAYPDLEAVFLAGLMEGTSIKQGISYFHKAFFSLPNAPQRSRKHLSTPDNNSSCKRINMFLRWMVRNDRSGVDFGIWSEIPQSFLICPLDVHVLRVAGLLGLINPNAKVSWQLAEELTSKLKEMDSNDPVKYDFALFSLGINEGWKDVLPNL